MRLLPDGLEQGFQVAAGELGMSSASWLFVRTVAQDSGDAGVEALRDQLGRAFPVLDGVANSWLRGERAPRSSPDAAVSALFGVTRLVVVGLEVEFLDRLVPALSQPEIALLRHSTFPVDWDRVLANFGGRVQLVDLDDFQGWAGSRSALLTFAYGVHGDATHVVPAWARATGEDVRTQFRTLLAWDVLGAPLFVYPRWLVEVPASAFTRLV